MKIEKFNKMISDNERKYFSHGGTVRCSICNCVSSEDIETNIGDYRPGMSFTQDPKNSNGFVCIECSEVVDDLRFDYELMDQRDD